MSARYISLKADPRARGMDVRPQLLLEIVPADLVLGVELDDPGRGFVLVEGVLRGFFQCVRAFCIQLGSWPSVPKGTSSKNAARERPSSRSITCSSGKYSAQGSRSTNDGS